MVNSCALSDSNTRHSITLIDVRFKIDPIIGITDAEGGVEQTRQICLFCAARIWSTLKDMGFLSRGTARIAHTTVEAS